MAECNNIGERYTRKNVLILRWMGERYISQECFFPPLRGERYISKNVFFLRWMGERYMAFPLSGTLVNVGMV